MNEQTELLREIRDLLRVVAEPALAERDKRLRTELLETVGKSKPKSKAVMLMDGSRGQNEIRKEAGIDAGQLSRLVRDLREGGLITVAESKPKLLISIQPNFFEGSSDDNG